MPSFLVSLELFLGVAPKLVALALSQQLVALSKKALEAEVGLALVVYTFHGCHQVAQISFHQVGCWVGCWVDARCQQMAQIPGCCWWHALTPLVEAPLGLAVEWLLEVVRPLPHTWGHFPL